MASEDVIVNVDGLSSGDSDMEEDGEEIDVGGDEGFELSEADHTDDGGDCSGEGASGNVSKKGHHNELEKRRRRTLNQSYSDLRKVLKKYDPSCKVNGRDKTLNMATKCLKKRLDQLRNMSEEAKQLIVDHRKMLPTADEEERKELQENIKELEKVADTEIELSDDRVVLEGFSGIPVGLSDEIAYDSDSDEESSLCDDEDDFDGGSESSPVAFCNSP